MSNKIYTSQTGLYSIRFKSDIIHEGIDHVKVSELLMNYQKIYDNRKQTDWPLEPEYMRVENFSGTYILKKKK